MATLARTMRAPTGFSSSGDADSSGATRIRRRSTAKKGASGGLCAAGFAGALFAGYVATDGAMRVRTRTASASGRQTAGQWSDEDELPIDGSGGAALASTFTELVLVARSGSGMLQCLTYDLQDGWSQTPEPLADGNVGGFALASFDHELALMLVFVDSSGNVTSRVRRDGEWAPPVPVSAAQMSPGRRHRARAHLAARCI